MTEKYYVEAPIPKEVEDFFLRRITMALHIAQWEEKGYMDRITIPTTFHWTIKAPFKTRGLNEYNSFISLLENELRKVSTNTAMMQIGLAFGNWDEDAMENTFALVKLKTIVMYISFPTNNDLKTLRDLKTAMTMDDLPIYTDMEQFNVNHVTLLDNLHELPLEEIYALYNIFLDVFKNLTITFDIPYITVMKKFHNVRWIVDRKIAIPYH
jgi:hypothetical protein